LAEKIFGDTTFARQWLNLPNPVFKNCVPIELAKTGPSARQVEAALSRMAHSDYV
jgi:uncharacterized protein (DUF2384 family)